MAAKLTFTLQVFFLGFSVVMIVLFALYGLIVLYNEVSSRLINKKKQEIPLPAEDKGIPLELAAAITAAVSHHLCQSSPESIKISISQVEVPGWTAAGRNCF
jgi:Na+-transporting methylmalonyl-CoA/oxaloacetate decarboxylase gamma subunit